MRVTRAKKPTLNFPALTFTLKYLAHLSLMNMALSLIAPFFAEIDAMQSGYHRGFSGLLDVGY